MPRRCVECNQALEATKIGEIEVDLCPGCGGLWLDSKELHVLAALSDEKLDGLRAALKAKAAPARAARSDDERLHAPCPACNGKLTHAEVAAVSLELCNRCGGVFLAAGELDQALAEARGRGADLATIAGMARSVSTHGEIG